MIEKCCFTNQKSAKRLRTTGRAGWAGWAGCPDVIFIFIEDFYTSLLRNSVLHTFPPAFNRDFLSWVAGGGETSE